MKEIDIKKITIDKCYKPKVLYRFNIELEKGSEIDSIGSCFCYKYFTDCFIALEEALAQHIEE